MDKMSQKVFYIIYSRLKRKFPNHTKKQLVVGVFKAYKS